MGAGHTIVCLHFLMGSGKLGHEVIQVSRHNDHVTRLVTRPLISVAKYLFLYILLTVSPQTDWAPGGPSPTWSPLLIRSKEGVYMSHLVPGDGAHNCSFLKASSNTILSPMPVSASLSASPYAYESWARANRSPPSHFNQNLCGEDK